MQITAFRLAPSLAVNAAVSHMNQWWPEGNSWWFLCPSTHPSLSQNQVLHSGKCYLAFPCSSLSTSHHSTCLIMKRAKTWNQVRGTATMLSNISQQPPSLHLASVHAAIAVRVQVAQGVSDGTEPWWTTLHRTSWNPTIGMETVFAASRNVGQSKITNNCAYEIDLQMQNCSLLC